MNNELLIGIVWSACGLTVTAFVIYLEYRRERQTSNTDKGGKHTTANPRQSVATFNVSERTEFAPGTLFANVKLPFPSTPGLHAKSVKDFYERKCGGYEVLKPIMTQPLWYRFDYEPTHTLRYRLRVFNRYHKTGKSNDPTARTMAFATAAKRAKALDAFIALHMSKADERGESSKIWRRPE